MVSLDIPEQLKEVIEDLAREENLSVEEYLKKVIKTIRLFQIEWKENPEEEAKGFSKTPDALAPSIQGAPHEAPPLG